MTPDQEQKLYTQLELYLSVADIGDRGFDQCVIDQCRAEYPNLVRLGPEGKPVTHLDDLLAFLHQSTGVPLELCHAFTVSCAVRFSEVSQVDQLREPELPFATLARLVKRITGSDLEDVGKQAFIDGKVEQLHQLLGFLMDRGKTWKEISKVVNNVRRFTAQHVDGLGGDDTRVKDSGEYVVDWLIQALYTRETTDQAMRFMARNGTSGKHLELILEAYPTNPMAPPPFAPKDGSYVPVQLMRDREGKLRSLESFGKIHIPEIADTLVRSALHFDDYLAIDHIRKIAPALQLSDDHVRTIAQDVLRYMAEYQAVNPDFSLNGRWIKKAYGGTLKSYWEHLASCNELKRPIVKHLEMSHQWSEIFRPDLLVKAPAEFISRLTSQKGLSVSAVNQFITQMHRSGIDCYQGFLLSTLDRLQYEEQKDDPVDYRYLVKQCIRNQQKAGFMGLLTIAPIEIVISSVKQPDAILEALYDLTADKRYAEAMSVHGRGRAFIQELGI